MGFLGDNEIRELLENQDGFDESNLKCASYELTLGDQFYLSNSDVDKIEYLDDKNTQVIINPGQFALLTTRETVTIPRNRIAFISIRAGVKFRGLVNVSGFHVDPGFNGILKFSVYNAGAGNVVLDRGKSYFVIWYSTLESEVEGYQGDQGNGITAEDVMKLNGTLASPNELLEKISILENKRKWNAWVLRILLGIAVTLSLKWIVDSVSYGKGYENGLKQKKTEEIINEVVKDVNIDSLVQVKLDSYIKERLEGDEDSL